MTADTQNTTIVSQPCCSLLWSTAALETKANRWQLPKGTTRFHTVAWKLSMKNHSTRTKATRWQLQNSTFFIPVAWKLSMKHRYTRTKANRWQLQSAAWKLSMKHYYTKIKATRWLPQKDTISYNLRGCIRIVFSRQSGRMLCAVKGHGIQKSVLVETRRLLTRQHWFRDAPEYGCQG